MGCAMVGAPTETQRFNVPSKPVRNRSSPAPKTTCRGTVLRFDRSADRRERRRVVDPRGFARRDDLRATRTELDSRELADAGQGRSARSATRSLSGQAIDRALAERRAPARPRALEVDAEFR